jgi:hypothetical protein
MTLCPNCGEMKLSHNVCRVCGHYDGKLVIDKTEKTEEQPQVEEKPKKKRRKKVEDSEDN